MTTLDGPKSHPGIGKEGIEFCSKEAFHGPETSQGPLGFTLTGRAESLRGSTQSLDEGNSSKKEEKRIGAAAGGDWFVVLHGSNGKKDVMVGLKRSKVRGLCNLFKVRVGSTRDGVAVIEKPRWFFDEASERFESRNRLIRFTGLRDERNRMSHKPGPRSESTIMVWLAETRGQQTDPLTRGLSLSPNRQIPQIYKHDERNLIVR
ncbi:hypothetical protein CRG98_012789 [Punica granatum]|uniref:Uncharacterized protein n=1 Tax=Punica granatum TaxID=22663 RepID=A0A2I0KF32_PUNGR|nr:hypothetical protein CRG98_012789 [Punica granatum]